jgi:ABC-type nitrate/sulfonate/bicarbonate transport system substrate-binding protein
MYLPTAPMPSSCGSPRIRCCWPNGRTSRTLDLDIAVRWRSFAGSERIPYLGVAAHLSWIAQHRELVPRLYRCYRDAARWVAANPAAAAAIISSAARLISGRSSG